MKTGKIKKTFLRSNAGMIMILSTLLAMVNEIYIYETPYPFGTFDRYGERALEAVGVGKFHYISYGLLLVATLAIFWSIHAIFFNKMEDAIEEHDEEVYALLEEKQFDSNDRINQTFNRKVELHNFNFVLNFWLVPELAIISLPILLKIFYEEHFRWSRILISSGVLIAIFAVINLLKWMRFACDRKLFRDGKCVMGVLKEVITRSVKGVVYGYNDVPYKYQFFYIVDGKRYSTKTSFGYSGRVKKGQYVKMFYSESDPSKVAVAELWPVKIDTV